MKGGYQIIDLGGIDINSSQLSDGQNFVINGIYDKIEGTDKPVLIQNYSVDGIEEKPFFGTLISEDAGFAAYHQNYKIVFLSTATDTIQVIKAGNDEPEEDSNVKIAYVSMKDTDGTSYDITYSTGSGASQQKINGNVGINTFNKLEEIFKNYDVVYIKDVVINDKSGDSTIVTYPIIQVARTINRTTNTPAYEGSFFANNYMYHISLDKAQLTAIRTAILNA